MLHRLKGVPSAPALVERLFDDALTAPALDAAAREHAALAARQVAVLAPNLPGWPARLDRLDRAVLEALCHRFDGGPVGLTTLAVAVGEEADTVETVAEPYLVREGFIVRTPRGRAATTAAWEHLGTRPPADPAGRFGHQPPLT